jgi:hypothetical protein
MRQTCWRVFYQIELIIDMHDFEPGNGSFKLALFAYVFASVIAPQCKFVFTLFLGQFQVLLPSLVGRTLA